MQNSIKKPILIFIILITISLGAFFIFFNKEKVLDYDSIIIEKGNLIQEVNVTGRVKSAESVELAFEGIGRISNIYVDVGNNVDVGQILVRLFNNDINAKLLGAKANLTAEEAKLAELRVGSRPEEIQIAQTKVSNAKQALKDSEANLESVKEKSEADLQSDYDSALTATQTAVSKGKTALLTLTDIQKAHFTNNDTNSANISSKKAEAIYELLGQKNAGEWNSEFISTLSGGAFGLVQSTIINSTYKNIDASISATLISLQKVENALNIMPVKNEFTSIQKINLSTEKITITAETTIISNKEQAITLQKVINSNNILTAENSINTAKNILASTLDDLALKLAGSTSEQIAVQEAKVKSAQANIQNYQAQISKTILRSPISGIVTRQDATVGEIISANEIIISLISEGEFEIESNIPEVDIAKINLGNTARVTLDAYGDDIIFLVSISTIYPAESIIEGVPTYKIKLQFDKPDNRIKSGMTANIDILTAELENIIFIPQRAVIIKNNNKFVRVLSGNEFKEVKVQTGLRDSSGNIEIVSGLNVGDEIITFIRE